MLLHERTFRLAKSHENVISYFILIRSLYETVMSSIVEMFGYIYKHRTKIQTFIGDKN